MEYCIAQKKHLPGILALYKQLVPDEEPLDRDKAETIWDNIERQGIKYFIAADGDRVVSSLYMAVVPNLTRSGK